MSEIKKEIDLSELPRKMYTGKEVIDWMNSVGCKCKFVYDDIQDEVEIVGYENYILKFKYIANIYNMNTTNFSMCKLGKILGKITNEFKIEIGTEFKDKKRDLIIINREYRKYKNCKTYKWYKYICNKCGWTEGWIEESSLLKGAGCSCCKGLTVVHGINDITTTAPWMVKYFVNPEDAKKYTKTSHKKIYPICPDCNIIRPKPIRISSINMNKSISCNCGDGFSYPNKFMFNILEQLNIDFETEYSPEWATGRKYDFYNKTHNIIIEMDGGLGHGNKDTKYATKEKSMDIDIWKNEQALKHGLKVIRINCNYDENLSNRCNYIKSSILNSELIDLFDFSKVNWNKSDKFATKNLVKEVCEYYEAHKGEMLLKDMASKVDISYLTLNRYLILGNKLNWCNYDKKEVNSNKFNIIKHPAAKKVLCIELNEEFESIAECSRKMSDRFNERFHTRILSDVCNGKIGTYKEFHFKFLNV